MTNTSKTVLKIVGLITLLIALYFVSMLVFVAVFGTGGQASEQLNGGLGGLLVYVLPIIIVGVVGYRVFKSKK